VPVLVAWAEWVEWEAWAASETLISIYIPMHEDCRFATAILYALDIRS
jgi:hypothetical protein